MPLTRTPHFPGLCARRSSSGLPTDTSFALSSKLTSRLCSMSALTIPGFASGDPYHLYGGTSLHRRSHGEALLQVVRNRFGKGIYLLDEPESALSPQRQMALLATMSRLVATRSVQFIVATHSPILMTFPGANILSFDDPALPNVRFDETEHFRLTRDFLHSPDIFWRELTRPEGDH